jgi:hypothetical protein
VRTSLELAEAASMVPERRPLRGVPEWLALSLYGVVVAAAIHFHEPWADEAQAWQIARSLSLQQMFQVLRYEGSPGLWHLLLWCLNRLHVSYTGMRWSSGAIALAGVAILLLCSPFPRWLKLLLPFSFFLVYQYAVVARSYVLAPILLFSLAALWPKRFEKPIAVAVLLGLLANVALHLAMFSGGFALVYGMELWWGRGRSGQPRVVRRLAMALVLLVSFYAFAVLTARPARDIAFPQGQSPLPAAQARNSERLARLRHGHSPEAIRYQFAQRLTPPLATGLVLPLGLALLFWAILCWALFREGKLRYLIPGVLFFLFCHFVAARPWHSGLMTPYVIALLWMVWPEQARPFKALPRYEQCALGFFFLIALIQIYWAAYALNVDRTQAYSPGAQTAAFLKPYVDRGDTILETGNHFDSVAIEPYFDRKVFANEPYSFHWWSTQNRAQEIYSTTVRAGVRGRPPLVLVQWLADGDTEPSQEAINFIPGIPELRTLGYRNTHVFCGKMPVAGAVILQSHCELVFEPSSSQERIE